MWLCYGMFFVFFLGPEYLLSSSRPQCNVGRGVCLVHKKTCTSTNKLPEAWVYYTVHSAFEQLIQQVTMLKMLHFIIKTAYLCKGLQSIEAGHFSKTFQNVFTFFFCSFIQMKKDNIKKITFVTISLVMAWLICHKLLEILQGEFRALRLRCMRHWHRHLATIRWTAPHH